jgi:anti-sigma factor RsiW
MTDEQQLKVQAYLDGELSATEQRHVSEWLGRDQEAAALLSELRDTTTALKAGEVARPLPESREFYWSKIQSQIDREARQAERGHPPAEEWSWLARLRRFIVPAAGVALAAIVAIVGVRHSDGLDSTATVTSLEDAQAFTYHDYASGATLVWLSYPADKHLAGEDEVAILE